MDCSSLIYKPAGAPVTCVLLSPGADGFSPFLPSAAAAAAAGLECITRLPPPSSASMIQNELRRSLCASEAGAAAEFHEDDGCAAACVCVWSRQSVCWLLFTGAHLHCCCFTADPCCIQVLWGKKGRGEPGLNVQCGSASKGGYYPSLSFSPPRKR